jgi:predicted glycosyltransferase
VLKDKLATARNRVAKLTERISNVSDAVLIRIPHAYSALLIRTASVLNMTYDYSLR